MEHEVAYEASRHREPGVSDGDATRLGFSSWSFGGAMPAAFESHAAKSIPLYVEGHDLLCKLSRFFCRPESRSYDLGSSTGRLLRALAKANADLDGSSWIGIDSEPAMVAHARELVSDHCQIEFVLEDLRHAKFEPSRLVTAYYTLQFLPVEARMPLVRRVYDSLEQGGAFILFEKVRAPSARLQELLHLLYWDYKLEQGLSAEHILQKAFSLIGLLEPGDAPGNEGLCRAAGFREVTPVMRYLCFEGLVAIK